MEINMVLFLPRDAVSVPVSRQVLDSCLETLGVAPGTRADIALALTEACANVIQHAGPGDQYEVKVTAKNHQCVIEVVDTGSRENAPAPDGSPVTPPDGSPVTPPDGYELDEEPAAGFALPDDPMAPTAEHGRGLKIIDAVVDDLRLTGNQRNGTTVHFEKTLEWVPGAAGQQLL